MYKKLFALLIAGTFAVSLTGCGHSAPEAQTAAPQTVTTTGQQAQGDVDVPQETQAQQTSAQDTGTTAPAQQTTAAAAEAQIGPLFQKFVRDKVADGTYTLMTEQSGMRVVMTVLGEDSAVESDAMGLLHFTLISKYGQYYMVLHNSGKYAQMSAEEFAEKVGSLSGSAVQMDNMRLQTTGTEKVNGQSYELETYDEGELGTVTYYFDDTGVRRTRVVKGGKTTVSDVFEVTDEADSSVLEIPSGYVRVDDPAQLLAQ